MGALWNVIHVHMDVICSHTMKGNIKSEQRQICRDTRRDVTTIKDPEIGFSFLIYFFFGSAYFVHQNYNHGNIKRAQKQHLDIHIYK